jgi:hypothetical protein
MSTQPVTTNSLERTLRVAGARIERIRRVSMLIGAVECISIPVYLLHGVFRLIGGRHWTDTWMGLTYGLALGGLGLSALAAMAYRKLIVQSVHRDISTMARIEDRTVIPILINSLESLRGAAKHDVIGALVLRLPELGIADRNLITRREQAVLTCQLGATTSDSASSDYDPKFASAILTALESTGDEDAIPSVRHLAERPPIGSPLGPVIEKATQCLDALVARQEQERESRVLVRAADAPEALLLKPVEADHGEDSGKLLVRSLSGDSSGERVH